MAGDARVVSVDALDWTRSTHGRGYERRVKRLGAAAGSKGLGCSLYDIPPGKSAWPFHYHTANEEAIFVLEGSGTLRLGNETLELSPGDYAALHSEEAGAHKLVNTGEGPLRYLCLSTMVEPDVTVYPDTGKVGIIAGSPPGGPKETRSLSLFLRGDAVVDYWDGED